MIRPMRATSEKRRDASSFREPQTHNYCEITKDKSPEDLAEVTAVSKKKKKRLFVNKTEKELIVASV